MELELSDHKKQIDQLHSGNETLKDRLDLSECYNYAFDLANLFIFYHINPLLERLPDYKSRYGNWKLFIEELSILKRNVKSGKQHPDDLENFVQPLQNELTSHNVDVKIIHLHDLIQNRNALTHGKIRSKEEQEEFMDLIDGYDFGHKKLARHCYVRLNDLFFTEYATPFERVDIRMRGAASFALLSSSCTLSQMNIENGTNHFLDEALISTQVLYP